MTMFCILATTPATHRPPIVQPMPMVVHQPAPIQIVIMLPFGQEEQTIVEEQQMGYSQQQQGGYGMQQMQGYGMQQAGYGAAPSMTMGGGYGFQRRK